MTGARRAREDQPRARRRRRPGPTACTRSRPSCSASSSPTRISLEPAAELTVEGFAADTLVRRALERARRRRRRRAGAGGRGSRSGSRSRPASAAAAPTRRRRCGSPTRCSRSRSRRSGCRRSRPGSAPTCRSSSSLGRQLGDRRRASALEPLELPQDYTVLLLLPHGAVKPSTAEVYGRFAGAAGFEERRARVLELAAAGSVGRPRGAPAERPRQLAARRAAARARRVPRRRHRRRPHRLRALRRAGSAPRPPARRWPGSARAG